MSSTAERPSPGSGPASEVQPSSAIAIPIAKRRRRRSSATRARTIARVERGLEGLAVAVVLGSALAVATVHTSSLAVVGIASSFAGAAGIWLMQNRGWRMPAPVLVLVALAAYCLLQAVPLPAGDVSILSPDAGDVWSRSL